MAYASFPQSESGLRARFAAFLAECGALYEALGAAIRVSSAVEHRRQPDLGDLHILGIRGPIPQIGRPQ